MISKWWRGAAISHWWFQRLWFILYNTTSERVYGRVVNHADDSDANVDLEHVLEAVAQEQDHWSQESNGEEEWRGWIRFSTIASIFQTMAVCVCVTFNLIYMIKKV